jgi:DNA-binding transcriptional regulator YhcF (GntR family)
LNLFVNRESDVPIHDQLCAQIGQLVAAGALTAGQRLPSVRALASRLGVHHNTIQAVYQALAAQGVLDVRQGSGVRVGDKVSPESGWRQGVALRALAAQYVTRALAEGHDAPAILAACQDALLPPTVDRLAVVNPHPDLQALYLHELGDQVALPMQGFTVEEVAAIPADVQRRTCFLTSTNHAAALQDQLTDDVVPVILTLASIEPMLGRARGLPAGASIAVISDSPRFLFLVPQFLAGVCDSERIVGIGAAESERWQRGGNLADLIVVDAVHQMPVQQAFGAKVYPFALIAEQTWVDLSRRLAPDAFRMQRDGGGQSVVPTEER